ncbi:MAG: pirin family protein [Oleibacter sp.]|nr:pirin family protein [Thalassolituus sp.]
MHYLRLAQDRGRANFGWLDSKHSFSFGSYYDPKHTGFSALRVINDDTVAPAAGFSTHSHRDMEIISYVLEGSIEHKDSMGNSIVIPAGDIQRMSAGTGVTHSEFNHSKNENLHFLQIWIQPNRKNIEPSYQQAQVVQKDTLTPLVTADGREGSLSLQQDANLYRLQLASGENFDFQTDTRPGYLHVISGEFQVNVEDEANDQVLKQGDAVGVFKTRLTVQSKAAESVALWFDLPAG